MPQTLTLCPQLHPHSSVHTAYIIFHHNGPICICSIINCLPLTRMYDWENPLCNQHPACNVVSANEAQWIRTGLPSNQDCNATFWGRASAGSSTPVTFLIISNRLGITCPIATSLHVMTVSFLWGHTREQQEGRQWGGVAWPPWSLTGDRRRCQIRCLLRPTPSLPHTTT